VAVPASLRDPEQEAITLHTGTRFRWREEGIEGFETGAEYPTTKRAVREAWTAEMERIFRLIEPLADRFVFAGSRFPPLYRSNVTTVESIPQHAPNPPRASRTNRFWTVLEEAVEAAGKPINPRGRETIDLEHWHRLVSDHFVYVLGALPRFALLTDRPFVGVFAEWLRHLDAAKGRRRRVIRATAEFPADPGRVPGFVTAVRAAVERLAGLLPRTGLDFYRAAVAALELTAPDATFPCDVLFVEQPGRERWLSPSSVWASPNRRGIPASPGRRHLARLPSPPWQMGQMFNPSGSVAPAEGNNP
jgi:hypothetical protein